MPWAFPVWTDAAGRRGTLGPITLTFVESGTGAKRSPQVEDSEKRIVAQNNRARMMMEQIKNKD